MEDIKEDLKSELITNGPLYTKEDCTDHDCVGMFIRKDDKILILYHIKMNRWAIPVGKVRKGQSIEDALKEESYEELGITIKDYKEIITTYRPYIINGIPVRVDYHIFEIFKYDGIIKNCESNKHKYLKFETLENIKQLNLKSTAMKLILQYIN